MEITNSLVFALLIAVCAANSAEWREQLPERAADVLGVIDRFGRSTDFVRFLVVMKSMYSGRNEIKADPPSSTVKGLTDVKLTLKAMSHQFMLQSYAYAVQHLSEFVHLALDMLQAAKPADDRNALEVSRFLRHYDYCLLTALYDWLFEVDTFFEIVLCLQSVRIAELDNNELGRFRVHLNLHRQRLDAELASMKIPVIPQSEKLYDAKYYFEGLEKAASKTAGFSGLFCGDRWRPFAKRYPAFAAKDLHDLRHETPFLHRVFHGEICAIHVEEIYQVRHQQNRITKWNCEIILDSPEYKFEKNKGDESPSHRIKGIFHKFKKSGSSNKSSKRFNGELVGGENMLSLAALKDVLKSNSYYLNVLKYYNVVADVVLFVAIKEGMKITNGIKQVVLRDCKKKLHVEICVTEMITMWLALSGFKSVFDDLVFALLDKQRINVVENPRKTEFDRRVKFLMGLLDFRGRHDSEHPVLQGTCRELLKELADIQIDDHHIDDKLKFEKYHFTDPTLNIRALYHFSHTDFW